MSEVNEPFEIRVRRWNDNKVYTMWVQITYRSDQVIRCTVTGGKKYMNLEKDLTKKTQRWKILAYNFNFNQDDKANALAFLNITEEIDDHLIGPKPDTRNPKWKTK